MPLTRSQILSLLSEACELEHGLACSYLYTGFSLKQELAEGDITWEQLQTIRRWAAQIYFVASEEMLHLAQAWNLLAAIGGTPYYLRPNFPQNSNYYPLNLPLLLEPFCVRAVQRFIYYERPHKVELSPSFLSKLDVENPEYFSVGELYAKIRKGIEEFPEETLFIGSPDNQVGPELVDFPDLIKVIDRQSALAAIDMITEQGEGSRTNTQDCHYGIFIRIEEELEQESEAATAIGRNFVPARSAAVNPVARVRGSIGPGGTLLDSPFAQDVSLLFDEIYGLMLRLLQMVFDHNTRPSDFARMAAKQSILLMVRVVKPLGEALMQIPAGPKSPNLRAGPSFALSRHVPLPLDERLAKIMVEERLTELVHVARRLAADAAAPSALKSATENLEALLASR